MHPAVAVILVYIGTAVCFQFFGFLVSRVVDYAFPAVSLMTFLLLFIGSLYLAWPVAVYITERFVPGAKPVST
jgi:hypothetical protein